MPRTHCMDILKDFLHANQLIVELVVSAGVGQECVPIRDEQVEYLHHLQNRHQYTPPHQPTDVWTCLYCHNKDVELGEQVFFTGGEKLEKVQQTCMFIHMTALIHTPRPTLWWTCTYQPRGPSNCS